MALCANFCATNMDPRFMALEDFSKLFQVPHPLRHFNCQWGPQRFRRWSFLGTKRFLIIFRFSQGGWIPIIGELFDTGVVSAIRDWKIVIDSIMATPRRENLSTNTHVLWGLEDISTVKNCLESSSGAWEPWRKKSSFPIEKVGSGRVQLQLPVEDWTKNKRKKMCTRHCCQVTYQRTITGDRNYFWHRVQEYCKRKENCNAWKSNFHFHNNSIMERVSTVFVLLAASCLKRNSDVL